MDEYILDGARAARSDEAAVAGVCRVDERHVAQDTVLPQRADKAALVAYGMQVIDRVALSVENAVKADRRTHIAARVAGDIVRRIRAGADDVVP